MHTNSDFFSHHMVQEFMDERACLEEGGCHIAASEASYCPPPSLASGPAGVDPSHSLKEVVQRTGAYNCAYNGGRLCLFASCFSVVAQLTSLSSIRGGDGLHLPYLENAGTEGGSLGPSGPCVVFKGQLLLLRFISSPRLLYRILMALFTS